MWNATSDLDLHVHPPSGDTVHWQKRTSRCGGELDVDKNVNVITATRTPIENVVWVTPRDGAHRVRAQLFADRDRGRRVPFTLEIGEHGQNQTF